MKEKKRLKNSEIATIEDFKRRLRTLSAKGNYKEVAEIHNQLGNQYRLLGMYEDALEQHQQEVKICKTHNKSENMDLGIAYRNIAEVYIDTKKSEKALEYANRYLNVARATTSYVEEQRALITKGRVYLVEAELEDEEICKTRKNVNRRMGSWREAEKSFREAYQLITNNRVKEQLNNEKEFMTMKCNNCQNLGLALDIQGNSQAVKWFQKAVEIGKQQNLFEYLHPCYVSLCNLFLKAKEGQKAVTCAKEAVKAAVSLESLPQEIEAKILEAKTYFYCDEVQCGKTILKKLRRKMKGKTEAAPFIEEVDTLLTNAVRLSRRLDTAWTSRREKDDQKLMKIYEAVADSYAELNLFHLSIDNYLKAVKHAEAANISGKTLSSLYFSIAESYKDCGDYTQALEYYAKEMELNESFPDEKFKTLTHITQLLEKFKSDDEVIKSHQQAIEFAKATNNNKNLATAYQNYSSFLKYIGDPRADSYPSENEPSSQDSNDLLNEDDNFDDEDIDLDKLSSDELSSEEENEHKNSVQAKRKVPKRKNEAGETPLHIAAKQGDLNGVRKYLRQGYEVNARDTAGWTPLHEAANYGCKIVVEELLAHGAKVNDPGGQMCDGVTPLHDALSNGHIDVAEVLLNKGASVLSKDTSGNFPIDQLILWRNSLEEEQLKSVHQDYKRMKQYLKDKMKEKGRVYTIQDETLATKRSRNRNKSPEFTVLKSLEARNSCPIPVRIANDSFDPDDVEEATMEYKNAMRSLLRKNPDQKKSREDKNRPISPGPRNALIPSELDVHEDWLVRDMDMDSEIVIRQPKKRTRKERRHSGTSSELLDVDEPTTFSSRSPSPFEITDMDVGVAPQLSIHSLNHESLSQDHKKHSTRSLRKNKRIPDSPPDASVDMIRTSSTSSSANTSLTSVSNKNKSSIVKGNGKRKRAESSSSPVGKTLRLKIKVLDKVLLVPVEAENKSLTIAWLCEQAGIRYKQCYGVKPILSLSTKDGALLCVTDPINLALSEEDSELDATLIAFDIPPLSVQYVAKCNEIGLTPRQVVIHSTRLCESTGALDLCGINIHGAHAKTVFQSLQGSSTLKELKLSECCIFDDDLAELSKVIGTLSGLSLLDLSSNAITHLGLGDFVDVLLKDCGQSGAFVIKTLDLSYNPLENRVAPKILDLVNYLPHLKQISMRDCNLNAGFFHLIAEDNSIASHLDDLNFDLNPELLKSLVLRNV